MTTHPAIGARVRICNGVPELAGLCGEVMDPEAWGTGFKLFTTVLVALDNGKEMAIPPELLEVI